MLVRHRGAAVPDDGEERQWRALGVRLRDDRRPVRPANAQARLQGVEFCGIAVIIGCAKNVCDLCMKCAFGVYAVCTVYDQSVFKVQTHRDESAYKGCI